MRFLLHLYTYTVLLKHLDEFRNNQRIAHIRENKGNY